MWALNNQGTKAHLCINNTQVNENTAAELAAHIQYSWSILLSIFLLRSPTSVSLACTLYLTYLTWHLSTPSFICICPLSISSLSSCCQSLTMFICLCIVCACACACVCMRSLSHGTAECSGPGAAMCRGAQSDDRDTCRKSSHLPFGTNLAFFKPTPLVSPSEPFYTLCCFLSISPPPASPFFCYFHYSVYPSFQHLNSTIHSKTCAVLMSYIH